MRRWTFAALLCTAAALGAASSACSDEHAEEAPAAATSPPDQSYTVRGRIVHVSRPEGPDTEVSLHHEAIDAFVSRDGEVVGMDAMTMPFSVAAGVPVSDLAAGDVVEVHFEVRWNGGDMLTITRLRKLPAETVIEDRRARPPGGADEAPP